MFTLHDLNNCQNHCSTCQGPVQIRDDGASKDFPVEVLQALLHTPQDIKRTKLRWSRFRMLFLGSTRYVENRGEVSCRVLSCSISWTRSWKLRNCVAAIIELYAPQANANHKRWTKLSTKLYNLFISPHISSSLVKGNENGHRIVKNLLLLALHPGIAQVLHAPKVPIVCQSTHKCSNCRS